MNFKAGNDATVPPLVSEEKKSSLALRIISAAILAPPVLAVIYIGPPFFDIMVGVCALILAWEWSRMHHALRNDHNGIAGRGLWLGVGAMYIIAASAALIWLRQYEVGGREIVFLVLISVWASDTGAYVLGSLIGGPRLAPFISPKKTWSGLVGGIVCAGGAGGVMIIFVDIKSPELMILGGAFLGAVSQGGDLFESWIKRRCGVKDASNIIPGHGGLFDRVDGLLAAALATVLVSFFSEGTIWQ